MNLLERYNTGNEIEVWNEIYSMNEITSQNEKRNDILLVLNETMQRVRFNFELIYSELKNSQYPFQNESKCLYPTADNEIEKLGNKVKEFGFLPLSIFYFYKSIYKINLLFQNNKTFKYRYSDPVYIESVENILKNMDDGAWEELMFENSDDENPVYMEISPDFYHKDNVSGGLPYGIEITKKQQIDAKILNTPIKICIL